MSYYVRRGFNKDLLPKEIPKQGRWIQQSQNGLRRPFNIWFEEKLFELNLDVPSFAAKLIDAFPKQPKTEETAIRYWKKDVIPRARSQKKIATVIANESNEDYNKIMSELIQVIEDEKIPEYIQARIRKRRRATKTENKKKRIQKKKMNITQESNEIKYQSKAEPKVVETLEVHKHSAQDIPQSKLIDTLYIRAEYRMVFIDKELQLFYIENGNKYIINFEFVLPLDSHELKFLMKVYPFSTLSNKYIKEHIEPNYDKYQHFSVQKKWLQHAAYSNDKIYVTTHARNLVQKHLLNPHIATKDVFDNMSNQQKEEYKINAIIHFSKRSENNEEYKEIYNDVSF